MFDWRSAQDWWEKGLASGQAIARPEEVTGRVRPQTGVDVAGSSVGAT